jgi:endonuclease I
VEEFLMKQLSLFGLLLSLMITGCSSYGPKHAVVPVSVVDRMVASEAAVEHAQAVTADRNFWALHPCPFKDPVTGQGAPFKKYHSFAVNEENRKILARSKEGGPTKALGDLPRGRTGWDNLAQFFEEKGITSFCSNLAKMDREAPSTGAPTQPNRPVKPRPSPGRPNPMPPAQGGNEGENNTAIPTGNFQTPITTETGLYYANLFPRSEEAPRNADGSVKSMQQRLYEFLSRPHVQAAGQPDLVVDVCPPNLENGKVCVTHKVHSYEQARRHMFGDMDLRKNAQGQYEVFDFYCQQWKGPKEYAEARLVQEGDLPAPGKIPNHVMINCEHTWPQSKFIVKKKNANTPELKKEVNFQETDLHHLFSTDNKLNALRGNYDFGEVIPNTEPANQREYIERISACSDSKFGQPVPQPGLTADGAGLVYEPPTKHKGNVARALFYFSSRYNMGMTSLQEYYLRKWHQEDPVDADEYARSLKAYKIIGTRNPFIDGPSLVNLVKRFCRVKLSPNQAPTANDCQ